MENKYAGYMLLGISIFIIILILLFNSTMRSFVDETCSLEHGLSCPMYEAISKPQKEVVIQTKTIEKTIEKKAPKKVFDISELKTDEKQVFELIKENKAVFQADLIEKTGFGKAKMTRIIDRLEGKGFVERKRRGMTNVVVLKE